MRFNAAFRTGAVDFRITFPGLKTWLIAVWRKMVRMSEMKWKFFLPITGLTVVGMMTAMVFCGVLIGFLRGIEIRDQSTFEEWSDDLGSPVPSELALMVKQRAGLQLERVLIVKTYFHKLFHSSPPSVRTEYFTRWRISNAALQADILKNLRTPDKRGDWLINTQQNSRFKPEWWPADLVSFHLHDSIEELPFHSSFLVSLKDRSRAY